MSTAATWKTYFIITGLPYVLENLTYNVELNIAAIEKTSGNFFATHRSPLLRFLYTRSQPFKCFQEDPVCLPTEISKFALTNDAFQICPADGATWLWHACLLRLAIASCNPICHAERGSRFAFAIYTPQTISVLLYGGQSESD